MSERIIEGGWLTLTRTCDARCSWCYAQDTGYNKSDSMSLELATQLISITAKSGAKSIALIGGEPTHYRHLLEVIALIRQHGMSPDLVTNGLSFARPGFAEKIKEVGVEQITLSVKAHSDEEYERVAKVKRGMTRVKEALVRCREAGIKVIVSVTVTNNFLEYKDSFLDVLVGLDPVYVDFGLADPIISESSVTVTGIPNPNEHAQAVTAIHARMKTTGIDYGFEMNIPFCLLDPVVKKELLDAGRMRRSCHIPTGTGLIFDEHGRVMPCNLFTSHPIGSYGRDFTTSEEFAQYWKSPELESFRADVTAYPHKKCASCSEWDMCGGGCMIKWLHWDPEIYIPGTCNQV